MRLLRCVRCMLWKAGRVRCHEKPGTTRHLGDGRACSVHSRVVAWLPHGREEKGCCKEVQDQGEQEVEVP